MASLLPTAVKQLAARLTAASTVVRALSVHASIVDEANKEFQAFFGESLGGSALDMSMSAGGGQSSSSHAAPAASQMHAAISHAHAGTIPGHEGNASSQLQMHASQQLLDEWNGWDQAHNTGHALSSPAEQDLQQSHMMTEHTVAAETFTRQAASMHHAPPGAWTAASQSYPYPPAEQQQQQVPLPSRLPRSPYPSQDASYQSHALTPPRPNPQGPQSAAAHPAAYGSPHESHSAWTHATQHAAHGGMQYNAQAAAAMQQWQYAWPQRPAQSGMMHGLSSGNTGSSSSGGSSKSSSLTHVDASGRASMVDVSQKARTPRVAQASACVVLGPTAFSAVQASSVAKGNVLTVAQLAGIMAAKQTANLIPLCHSLALSKADVQLSLLPYSHSVYIRALAKTVDGTGVEMEALMAASVAALTVYDMCKALAKDIKVGDIQLDYKAGGRSGIYIRPGLTQQDLLEPPSTH